MDVYSVFATIVKANILLQDKLFPNSASIVFMNISQLRMLFTILITYIVLLYLIFSIDIKKN